MFRIVAVAALILGAYALVSGGGLPQAGGGGGSLFDQFGGPARSIGASAVGAAGAFGD
jgi:hypothetical protein